MKPVAYKNSLGVHPNIRHIVAFPVLGCLNISSIQEIRYKGV